MVKVGRNIVESGIKHHKFNFEVSQLYIIYVYLLDTRSEVALIKKNQILFTIQHNMFSK